MPLWTLKDVEGQKGEAARYSSPRWTAQQSRKLWEIRVPKDITGRLGSSYSRVSTVLATLWDQ